MLLHPWDFSRQDYWSGLPFLSAGDLPNPGIKPRSPAWQTRTLPSEITGKPLLNRRFSTAIYVTQGKACMSIQSPNSSHPALPMATCPFPKSASLVLPCYCSVAQSWGLFVTPWTTACQASLSFTITRSLLKRMPIESVMPSKHLILCRPLLLPSSIFPSTRVFSNESASQQVAKVLEFQLQHLSFQWILRIDFFRINWFDFLAVQGTLKSLL